MTRINRWNVFVVAGLLAAGTGFALAQMRKGPGKGMPKYDPATEIILKGTVEEVKQMEMGACPMCSGGTHLVLKADQETLEVHVAPSWFLKEKGFSFTKGDALEVTGSKVKFPERDALVAREIKKGDHILILRNPQGVPEWAAGRRPS